MQQAASGGGTSSLNDTAFISKLASALAHPFKVGFSDSMHVVFWSASGVMVVGLIIILFLPELPLRAHSAVAARAAEDAAAVPEAQVPEHG